MPRKTTRFKNYTFPAKPLQESDLKKLDKISAKYRLGEKMYPHRATEETGGELLPFEEHLRLIAEHYREFEATEFATFKDNKNFLTKIKRRSSNLVKGLNELSPEAKSGWVLTRIRSLAEADRSVGTLYKTIGTIETEIKTLQDEIEKIKRYQKTLITNKRIKAKWRCYVAADVYGIFKTFSLDPKRHDESEYYLCIRIVLSHAGGRLGKESIKGFFSNCRDITGDKKFHIPKPPVPSPK